VTRRFAPGLVFVLVIAAIASSRSAEPRSARGLPLHVDGRSFVAADGSRFIWRGMTAFRLLQMIARREDIDPYLAWCAEHGVTIVRTLTMAKNLFELSPADGRTALPRLLERAERYGLRVEVVAFSDTKSYDVDDEAHVTAIGRICAAHPACVVELGNELDPLHPTQSERLGDPRYVAGLRALIPASVAVAFGSSHGAAARTSIRYAGGDFVTVHEDRSDGDEGWRWVRERKKTGELAERLGKPLVGDEPQRDDLAAERQFAFGALARMVDVGDTFHYAGGLAAQIPSGEELAAFESRRRGWDAIPPEFRGTTRPPGAAGSPVADVDPSSLLEAFSVLSDRDGYVLVIGKDRPAFKWADDWPRRSLVHREGRTTLWRVER
jgi:hypothetical protein